MNKEWLNIPGCNGFYQINRCGEVRSVDRFRLGKGGSKTFCKGRVMSQRISKNGYKTIGLRINMQCKQCLVHRLVALTFIPNPESLLCVDHINGDRSDNRVENLRWCSHKQNLNYDLARSNISASNRVSTKCKLHLEEMRLKCIKPIVVVYPNGVVSEYNSARDAEKDGFNHSLIAAVCKGKQKTHRGCIFYYKRDYYAD